MQRFKHICRTVILRPRGPKDLRFFGPFRRLRWQKGAQNDGVTSGSLSFFSSSLLISALFFNLVTPTLYAQGKIDYTIEVSQKLGRGVINVVSSPAEIPCTLKNEVEDRGAIGSVSGFFRGIVFMLRRVLVGATEIMSFVIPMKETLPPVCARRPPAQVQV